MSSVLKRTTANVPSTRQTSDALFSTSELLVAGDVLTQVTTAKHLTTFYMSGLSADIKPRLPSVGSADDGLILRFFHDNNGYEMTPYPYDSTTSVWNSGKGYGITLCEQGCYIELRYVHALTKWIVTYKAGGLVKAEGVVLHEKMQATGELATVGVSTSTLLTDLTNRHAGTITGDVSTTKAGANFAPSALVFDGTGDNINYADSTDWDIFGDQTGHKTVAFWVYIDSIGGSTADPLVAHREDASNWWYFNKGTDDLLDFIVESGGTNIVSIVNCAGLSTAWHHVALIVSGSDVGLYIDGVQKGYDGAWAADSFTGSLYIGTNNSGTYFDGRMQDLFIAYNNPFNAEPNDMSGTPDSFTKPEAPMQLVM